MTGAGEVTHTAFSIPPASLPYWENRLAQKRVQLEQTVTRMGESVLTFSDPDGNTWALQQVPPWR